MLFCVVENITCMETYIYVCVCVIKKTLKLLSSCILSFYSAKSNM